MKNTTDTATLTELCDEAKYRRDRAEYDTQFRASLGKTVAELHADFLVALAARDAAIKIVTDLHTPAEIEAGRAVNAAADAASLLTMQTAFASLAEKDKSPALQQRCTCGGRTNVRREHGVTICDDCAN